MTKLEQLIEQLCPDGVEYKQIGDVVDYEQPSKYLVKSTDYNDEYETPVLTAGQTFILGYTDETDGIYQASADNPVIIFDDFTGAFKWVDFPFKAKSSAMKMLKAKEKSAFLRYIFHLMGNIGYNSDEHKRLWIGIYSNISIPVPPLEVQAEIVRILDTFTELTTELITELITELTNRKKQYEYYSRQLFVDAKNTQLTTLEQLSHNLDSQRQPVTSNKRTAGIYPYYGASGIVDYVDDYIFDGDYLLISEDGANLLARNTPIAFSISGKTWVNNHAHVLKFDSYHTRRYVEIYLNSVDLSPYITGAAQPKLNQKNLNKIEIPLPPNEEQRRIVDILDRFDKLCNDLSEGLRAEIEARQKQYEYYRDKLLTFKERVN